MLVGLSIRDIVLIDRLDLHLRPGLSALTGETGAGKSILLDSLGLALGMRADSGLVRNGAEQGSVSAEFDLGDTHPAWALLAEQGLAAERPLVLRRVVAADGRSRAFVNDQPVSVGLLRRIGDSLVEIHGQGAEQALHDQVIHREILDSFAGMEDDVDAVRVAHGHWRQADKAVTVLRGEIEQARRDEDFLRHAVDELAAFNPQPGEEATLAESRSFLQHTEKVVEGLAEAVTALDEGDGVQSRLRLAQRVLERVAGQAGGRLDDCLAALDRAAVECAEAAAALDAVGRSIESEPNRLDTIEERLFALRALARKHQVVCDELPTLRRQLADRLAAVEDATGRLTAAERVAAEARRVYQAKATAVSQARQAAARRLDKAVAKELKPLKLAGAVLQTQVSQVDLADGGAEGFDRVAFFATTNPGASPGPLARIASGGELSRFMLALKVVLSGSRSAPTLVFDEADRGVGGSTADAVGERLARLAETLQVLVVTHSPQVAARADHHLRVVKATPGRDRVATVVEELDAGSRREEVARMLAGARVTEEARAAADSLIAGSRG